MRIGVTYDRVGELLGTYDREATNPMSEDGVCLYTAEDDHGRHCIVGQLLTDLGLQCPPSDKVQAFDINLIRPEDNAGVVVLEAGIESALRTLQRTADGTTGNGPLPWGEAIDEWPSIVRSYRHISDGENSTRIEFPSGEVTVTP